MRGINEVAVKHHIVTYTSQSDTMRFERTKYCLEIMHMLRKSRIFKGLAKAVDQACQIDPRVTGIPSTKGIL